MIKLIEPVRDIENSELPDLKELNEQQIEEFLTVPDWEEIGADYVIARLKLAGSLFDKWENCGANDTEPLSRFEWCIAQTLSGDETNIPATVELWELYFGESDSATAAGELRAYTKGLVELIKRLPFREIDQVRAYSEGE